MKEIKAFGAFAALAACLVAAADEGPVARRIFREPRFTRGNLNLLPQQPADAASWLWHPDFKDEWHVVGPRFLRFRKSFVSDGTPLVFDVTADERFALYLDGRFVARGPNRGTPENWQYQSYEVRGLAAGEHVFEAVCWKTEEAAPLAQLSWRGGFLFKAEGAYDEQLTTGSAAWEVGRVGGTVVTGRNDANGVWGTGAQWEVKGAGVYTRQPETWTKAVVVRGPASTRKGNETWGLRISGWMLYPTELPDQTETRVRPGAFKAVSDDCVFRSSAKLRNEHVFTAAEASDARLADWNALLREGRKLTVPAGTKLTLAWDLGKYFCAYPVLKTSGGAGAKVAWMWTESSREAKTRLKADRAAIAGKFLDGYGDTFVSDGRAGAEFGVPWFRCGKWCRLDVVTGDAPLTIDAIELIESRYPLEMASDFSSPQDPSLAAIRAISARGMQMCCHETLYDCPYYEQQMYPGDTRVQLRVLSAMDGDDRIIRRAIETYDLNRRDDGTVPFNFPTRMLQEGLSYTLCYLCMYGDYLSDHANRAWLKARLAGLRNTMAGVEYYENAQGLLENPPGWSFTDWVVGWRRDGTPEGARFGEGVNAELNLFWALAMKSAADVERALGNELQARYWDEKREKLAKTIVGTFWCDGRGILSDTPAMKDFSEHAQCLALLADALPADKAASAWKHLIEDEDLKRCTVYFSYYLFETYFRFGRGDLFLKRLDLWRSYAKLNLSTCLESPDDGKKIESRSDCHAWGSHPIWFMQTGLAGIRSAAPFFAKVRVAPCPGGLKEIRAKHPHPQGFVEVDLTFADGRATGTVKTPVPGTFVYGGRTVELKVGTNAL